MELLDSNSNGSSNGRIQIVCNDFESSLKDTFNEKIPIICNNPESNSNDFSKRQTNFFCKQCDKSFSTNSNLKRHEKTHNNEICNNKIGLRKNWCEICNNHYTGCLSSHYKKVHQFNIEIRTLQFDSLEHFELFRRKTELQTGSRYSCRNTRRDNNGIIIRANYVCSRRGSVPKERPVRKRAPKLNLTIKIGELCPAQFTLHRNCDGHYILKWTVTHIGHEIGNNETNNYSTISNQKYLSLLHSPKPIEDNEESKDSSYVEILNDTMSISDFNDNTNVSLPSPEPFEEESELTSDVEILDDRISISELNENFPFEQPTINSPILTPAGTNDLIEINLLLPRLEDQGEMKAKLNILSQLVDEEFSIIINSYTQKYNEIKNILSKNPITEYNYIEALEKVSMVFPNIIEKRKLQN